MYLTNYTPNHNLKEFSRGFNFLNSMLNDMNISDSNIKFDWTPSINTREGEYAYHIEIDLPGVNKDDIDISINDDTLEISGERKVKEEKKEHNYYKVESHYGSFSKSLTLPSNVDTENIDASSQDGILEITIPKLEKEDNKTKKITIK